MGYMILGFGVAGLGLFGLGLIASSIKIVRPVEKGLIERFGKYNRLANPGLNLLIPAIEKIRLVNLTEIMIDAKPQEIITKDKLNATVDAQVYFKIRSDEQSIKASQYNVYDCEWQIINLARTTLRNIIGTMSLSDANSERDKINFELMKTLTKETLNWGIEVVRTELKEINPPKDVQATMNEVVKAENEKIAAVDLATAAETEADGFRRAAIKKAEGESKAVRIRAEAEAEAIKLVNESAEKYFKGNAQTLKQLEVTEASLKDNAKIILTERGINPVIVFGEGKIVPLREVRREVR